MKFIVFSDSHGSSFTMREALSRCRGADYAVHAGDGAPDLLTLAREYGTTPVAVRGNCDLGSDLPYEAELTVCGVHVLIVHGHKYGVKFSLSSLISSARRRGCDLVIFGHTHEKYEKYVPADEAGAAVRLFNPGAARDGDFGIIDISEGGILMSHGNVFDRE